MPRKIKKTTRSRTKKIEPVSLETPVVETFVPKRNYARWAVLGVLVLTLGFLVWRNKGLFVAATVNGQPLWRLSLEQQLDSRYSSQTLDEMVGEMLISQAAASKKITVTKADVDAKVAEIEKSLNGQVTLKDALAQQGETLDTFRQRVELQLMLEKLTVGQVTVSDQEVADYVTQNKNTLTATDDAGMTAEAKQALLSQKQNSVLSQYFTNLKSQAKVSKFL